MVKLKGKWQKGEIRFLSADQFSKAVKRASVGVKKPVALEQESNRWRVVHKPLRPGEFWD